MSSTRALTLPSHTLSSDSPQVRAVLERAKEQVGFLPNMCANMVNSPGLLETYLFGYNRFRKESGFSPAEQEVVFLTISRENGCHYCVAAHSMLAEKRSGVPKDVIDALRDGTPIQDAKLAALSDFTRTLLKKRGWVDRKDVGRFVAAGFAQPQVCCPFCCPLGAASSDISRRMTSAGGGAVWWLSAHTVAAYL